MRTCRDTGMGLTSLLVLLSLLGSAASREYCQMETFEATCPEGHVILMEFAKYGRMKLGQCLTRDYYVGCSADVLDHLHARCSGRRQCSMSIPDPVLFEVQPCPSDLVVYLDAQYTCVPVAMSDTADCSRPTYIDASPGGYLSTLVSQELSVGTQQCPWRLYAMPGQRINFTLLEFTENLSLKQHSNALASLGGGGGEVLPAAGGPCTLYGYILDGQATRKRICGVRGHLRQHVYTTTDHQVDVVLQNRVEGQKFTYGLIHYQVVGCPMLEPPVGGWVEIKEDNAATIHCNFSTAAYHLVCDGNRWMGDVRNCSKEYTYVVRTDNETPQSLPYGLFIAIAIGLALGIMIGVTLLLVVFILCKRRKSKHRRPWMSEQGSSLLQKQHGKSAESSLFIEADPRNYTGASLHMPCGAGSAGTMGTLSSSGDGSLDHRRLIQLMPLKHSNPNGVPIYDTHSGVMEQSECLYYTHPISTASHQPASTGAGAPMMNVMHECDSGVDGCSLVDCTCPAGSTGGGGVGGGGEMVTLGRMGMLPKDTCGMIPELPTDTTGTAATATAAATLAPPGGRSTAARGVHADKQPDITDTSHVR